MTRDPFLIDGPTIINVSGGRTSALMLRRYLDANGGALPPDCYAVFANTGREHPKTLDFVRDFAEAWEVDVRWIERDASAPAGARFREVTHDSASRDGKPFADLIAQRHYLPNAVSRFCTTALKIETARDFMRAQGHSEWTSAVGLRRDEPARVAKIRARDHGEWDVTVPLFDAHVTKADVMAFWAAAPFDLALEPWQSNCDGCFLKSASILERTEREAPGSLAWWSTMERAVGATFVKGRTYLRVIERATRPMLPGLLDAEEAVALPCSCTDRRKPRRCTCGKRRGDGHALSCAMLMGAERGPRVIYADGPRAPIALDGRAA